MPCGLWPYAAHFSTAGAISWEVGGSKLGFHHQLSQHCSSWWWEEEGDAARFLCSQPSASLGWLLQVPVLCRERRPCLGMGELQLGQKWRNRIIGCPKLEGTHRSSSPTPGCEEDLSQVQNSSSSPRLKSASLYRSNHFPFCEGEVVLLLFPALLCAFWQGPHCLVGFGPSHQPRSGAEL